MSTRWKGAGKVVPGGCPPIETDAIVETVLTDDRLLIERLRNGDPGAVEEIVDTYKRQVFAFIIRMIGDRETAEDLFQETWLRVVRSSRGFRGDSKISTWILQIALNLCRDHIRKIAKTVIVPLDEVEPIACGPGIDPIRMLQAEEVRNVVNELPVKMREVIVLRFYHDLDDREIADTIGCPVGTVKTRYHRAVKILAKKWDLRTRAMNREEIER
jgi:RNA polymerase sigma factor (sigma-70 family)